MAEAPQSINPNTLLRSRPCGLGTPFSSSFQPQHTGWGGPEARGGDGGWIQAAFPNPPHTGLKPQTGVHYDIITSSPQVSGQDSQHSEWEGTPEHRTFCWKRPTFQSDHIEWEYSQGQGRDPSWSLSCCWTKGLITVQCTQQTPRRLPEGGKRAVCWSLNPVFVPPGCLCPRLL